MDARNQDVLDARRGTPSEQEGKFIKLTRQNTVLLLPTVAGDGARRGFYTSIFADQLRTADGKTDIYEMHLRTVERMTQIPEKKQKPEYRETLAGKRLILPKVAPGHFF